MEPRMGQGAAAQWSELLFGVVGPPRREWQRHVHLGFKDILVRIVPQTLQCHLLSSAGKHLCLPFLVYL